MRAIARYATYLFAIFASCAAGAAELDRASLDAARSMREAALASPEAYALVASLSTEIGPRLAGSAGDLAAIEWAARQFERLGFSNVRRAPVLVPQWVRGTAELTVDALGNSLSPVALGGSIGTPEEGLRAEVVQVPDVETLASIEPERVRGRFVYLAERTERTRDASGYSTAVRGRRSGPSAAAAKGAIGFVLRSIGTSNNRLAHTGTTRYDAGSPRIPAVAIANPDADLLEKLIARGPVHLRMKVTARELPDVQSANVIGEVPGTDRAHEIVLLGAHLDSWDLGQGALDDAAGVAIVTAAARLIADAKLKPRRTIRVVLFANEEFGLSGANAYAAGIGDELERHAVAMEADLGDGPVWELQSRVAREQLPLVRAIHRAIQSLGVSLGGNDAEGGSDLGPLRRAGVPVLGPRLDASRYFDHHHSANDTLDKVDRERLNQSVAVFAVAAYLAARADTDFRHLQPITAEP